VNASEPLEVVVVETVDPLLALCPSTRPGSNVEWGTQSDGSLYPWQFDVSASAVAEKAIARLTPIVARQIARRPPLSILITEILLQSAAAV
jgi:hypothetical protein